jgi:hypothetical protein
MSELERLRSIKTFPSLVKYLRDELDWPIESDDFEDLTFDYEPEELGIDVKTAAKIEAIKQLRPLVTNQPWGIFFIKFEPKRLPVVALRKILSQLVIKKRASSRKADQPAWHLNDILFISNYGEGDNRQITFAQFAQAEEKNDLPTLKVLGWDDADTVLHIDHVHRELKDKLRWPDKDKDTEGWRKQWSSAFILKHREVISTSKELAVRLADLARRIRRRANQILTIETAKGPLRKLHKAFQTALIHDLKEDDFADMYAQTIAYGLLTARVTNPKGSTADDLATQMLVTNPFLRELMEAFLHVGGRRKKAGGSGIDFDELGISEVVELLDDAKMVDVLRDFGDRNPQEDPIIHFYELFLKEYDAKKRMQRGVFYTPRPVVSYIVRSVDKLLRTEFGLEDGLADTTTWGDMAKRHKDLVIPEGVSPSQSFVQILDPATGTGTFLVEVIELINKTLVAKWKTQGHSEKKIEALWNEYVPRHLMPRLHGYELLMAPYAIAHLKIGLKLYESGYLFDSDERTRVYLTNALEPAHDFSGRFEFVIPALAHEAQAVNEIKRKKRFTIVIGNPPYAGHSSNVGEWITSLVRDYYLVDGKPIGEANPKYLLDDYVKFFRYSAHEILRSHAGILGLITNNGFLDNPTFRGMRQQILSYFQTGWIVNLHGSTKKREISPDGSNDENVFDIQQGVAISLFISGGVCSSKRPKGLEYEDLWGMRAFKYARLLANDESRTDRRDCLRPCSPYYLLTPSRIEGAELYLQDGVLITDVFKVTTTGVKTHRDHFVYSTTQDELYRRLNRLKDSRIPDEKIREEYDLRDTRDWRLPEARKALRTEQLSAWISECLYRPFDVMHYYASGSVVELPRLEVMNCLLGKKNIALGVGRQGLAVAEDLWDLAIVSAKPIDTNLFRRGGVQVFPLLVHEGGHGQLFSDKLITNFRNGFLSFLKDRLGIAPRFLDLFSFIYAQLYSQAYRKKYAEYLSIDFPRILVPSSLDLFRELARLGSELIAMHLMNSSRLDHLTTTFTGPKRPEVERVGWHDDTVWLDATATKKGQPAKPGTIGFKGVPEDVWKFHIGGYQVCEKWLKDRKGRTLSEDDIEHYQKIVVALSETIRIMAQIDEVIEEHGGWPGAFN